MDDMDFDGIFFKTGYFGEEVRGRDISATDEEDAKGGWKLLDMLFFLGGGEKGIGREIMRKMRISINRSRKKMDMCIFILKYI